MMRSAAQILVLAFALNVVSATKLVLTGSTTLIPEDSTIFQLDTETGNQTVLLNVAQPDEDLAAYSDATVCGTTYYAVFANPPADFGIFSVDLQTNTFLARTHTSNLWHKLACDPTDDSKLLGVSSDVAGVFYIAKFDLVTNEDTTIAAFPDQAGEWAGYDCQFAFDSDTKPTSLYVSWPYLGEVITTGGPAGGVLLELDVQTGQQLFTAQFPMPKPEYGQPYFMVPSSLKNNTMSGVMWYYHAGATILRWTQLTLPANDGETIAYDPQSSTDVTSDAWSASKPQVVCNDGYLYTFAEKTSSIMSVSQFDTKSGALVKSFKLKTQESQRYGALACNE